MHALHADPHGILLSDQTINMFTVFGAAADKRINRLEWPNLLFMAFYSVIVITKWFSPGHFSMRRIPDST